MASGIKVNKECSDVFEDMKMRKKSQFVIFKVADDLLEIVVRETGERGASYEDFAARMMAVDDKGKQQCAYGVLDFDFEFEGQMKNKIVFFIWAPAGAPITRKMVYTSSKESIKKAVAITCEVQATDEEEMSRHYAVEKARIGQR